MKSAGAARPDHSYQRGCDPSFPNDQRISTGRWRASHTQTQARQTVTGRDAGYNANIPANGGSVMFGFDGAFFNSSNPEPASCSLNGPACTVVP